MKFLFKLFLCVVLGLLPLWGIAQQEVWQFEGKVLDEAGEPVSWATVYLLSTSSGKILAYTHSEGDGSYGVHLAVDTALKAVYLRVDLLGYEKQEREILLQTEAKVFREDFLLQTATFTMDEVVVNDSLPPLDLEKSDTTEYRVADYSDSTEVYVEELLKKMPGVKIGEHGEITVNGKPVQKILIEGDDFFGNNYTVVSRNMRANAIERVQLIDNYLENPVFHDVLVSDDLVLNLLLKEEVKTKPNGTATVGLGRGDEWKWAFGGNLFSFGKKQRLVFLLNGDNISSSFWGTLKAFGNQGLSMEHLNLPKESDQSLLSFSNPYSVGLSPKFDDRRQSGLGTYAHIFALSPAWKLKLYGLGKLSEDRQVFVEEAHFFFDSLTFSWRDDKFFRLVRRTYAGVLSANYLSPNHKQSLSLSFQLKEEQSRQWDEVQRTVQDTAVFSWPAFLTDKPLVYALSAEYTYKLNERWVLQAAGNHLQRVASSALSARSDAFAAFTGVDTTYTSLWQPVASSQRMHSLFLRAVGALKHHRVQLQAGLSSKVFDLSSFVYLLSENLQQRFFDEGYWNRQLLEESRFSFGLSESFTMGHWLLRLKLKADYVQPSLRFVEVLDTVFWAPETLLSLRYKKSNLFGFSIAYGYSLDYPDSRQLLASRYFPDAFTVVQGAARFDLLPVHFANCSLSWRNFMNNRRLNFHLSLLNRPALRGQSIVLSPYIVSMQPYFPASGKALKSELEAEYFVLDWALLFKLGWNYAFSQSESILEGGLRYIYRYSNGLSIFLGKAFSDPFNMQWENNLDFTRRRVEMVNLSFTQQGFTWRSELTFNYLLVNSPFSFRARWYYFTSFFSGQKTASFFAGELNLHYGLKLRNRPATLTLSAVNLTQASAFETFAFSDYFERTFTVEAVPFFVLFKFDLSL